MSGRPSGAAEAPWAASAAAVAAALGSDAERGLTEAEAQSRLARYGANELEEEREAGWWRLLIHQFTNTMTVILMVACGITVFIGDIEDVVIILAIVVLNGLIGFIQELRSERAIQALKSLAAPTARVLRGGGPAEIPARELVPGDVLDLEAGQVLSADARLLESAALLTNEAPLTGEALPVTKSAHLVLEPAAVLPERTNMVYQGTAIVGGRGRAMVVATGAGTELGRIAATMQSALRKSTPLQVRLTRLGRTMAMMALAVCAIVLVLGLLRGERPSVMLLTAVSLAVAAVPEALPAVVTISLALGARRMAQRRAIVRRLAAVETLGSVNVICTDKTGTITAGRMAVQTAITADGPVDAHEPHAADAGAEPVTAAAWLELIGALCNDAVRQQKGAGQAPAILGDPTEVALLEFAEKRGLDVTSIRDRWARVTEFPFDAVRRRMTTVHRHPGGGYLVATKGAADAILPHVTTIASSSGGTPASEDRLAEWQQVADSLAREGQRVLALAGRLSGSVPERMEQAEDELTLYGVVGMADPPRASAPEAVAACKRAGIATVMITGDHPATAEAAARQVGIAVGRVLTGRDLARLSPGELRREIPYVSVLARIAPDQKLSIVEAWQANGAVVAMTGDGVNDGPALRRADIGVAMGLAGTDVAREAADMVLADDDFATIVSAIREGRRIYDNIRRFVRFGIATNAAEVGLMLLGPGLGLPLPLLPVQILWINLVTDGLPGIGLGLEAAEPDVLDRAPRPRREDLFAGGMWFRIGLGSGLMIALTVALGMWARAEQRPWQTMMFTTLALLQLTHALGLRSQRQSIFRLGLRSNPLLLLSVLVSAAVQLALPFWPAAHTLLGVEPLSPLELGLVAGVSTMALWLVEIEKLLARRPRHR